MRTSLPPRPPVRWSTHAMQILMVLSVAIGGTLFGLAFALWPQGVVDVVIGIVMLAGVAGLGVWVVYHLMRPVE